MDGIVKQKTTGANLSSGMDGSGLMQFALNIFANPVRGNISELDTIADFLEHSAILRPSVEGPLEKLCAIWRPASVDHVVLSRTAYLEMCNGIGWDLERMTCCMGRLEVDGINALVVLPG